VTAPAATPLLEGSNVTVKFGGLTAVGDMTLAVNRAQIVGLMGPNGAGKTTLFNALSGHQPVASGEIRINGVSVTKESAFSRARRGLARTFQLGGLVGDLTVLENIALGFDHGRRLGHPARSRSALIAAARAHLTAFGLEELEFVYANNLGAGLRRRVEVARVMAAEPTLVLLDEPAAGLAHDERDDLAKLLASLRDRGIGLLVTEHTSDFLFAVADQIVVMNFGRELLRGPADVVRSDQTVLSAYLGGQHQP
jgi:branched-chain amino acid transport system permease protein